MVSTRCPDAQQLAAFAVGEVSPSQWEQLAGHVEVCPVCEDELDRFDLHSNGLLTELRGLPQPGSAASGPSTAGIESPSRLEPSRLQHATRLIVDHGSQITRALREGPYRLGRFELLEELGVGTFGYVFRARDTELDRVVALKVQRAGQFASEAEAERFLREARSAAQLKHPAIVAVHDTGRTEDGVCYLVSEFVEGQTLERFLQTGRPGYRESSEIVARLTDALDYAHSHGVIHRDVKPSNIMVCARSDRLQGVDRPAGRAEGGRYEPVLMDFGLAKRDAGEATMTLDGQVMGTPAYMSPEQARGHSHEVDARTDVYSLGVVLYELLSGRRPFEGERRALLVKVLEDEPPRPRQIDRSIPRDLETICLKATDRAPARRYQTAREFADDLRRYLAGEPIAARRLGHIERLSRWCRRYPLAASLFLAVLACSAAGFAHLTSLTEWLVKQTALDGARTEALTLEAVNTYYSDRINSLPSGTIKITHEYHKHVLAMPLPATMMIELGELISGGDADRSVRLYSAHPWPGRADGGPKTPFEYKALEVLEAKAADPETDLMFHEFVESDGRRYLHFAKGQIMQQSCVDCHNGAEQSPKRDWKVGDLAGVLEFVRPLDRDIQRIRDGLRGTFALMGGIAGLFLAVGVAAMFASRRRRERRG